MRKEVLRFVIRSVIVGGSLATLGHTIWYGNEGVLRCSILREENSKLIKKLEENQQSLVHLETKIQSWNEDLKKEKRARKNYLCKANEIVYVI